jgi:hypothetical protein
MKNGTKKISPCYHQIKNRALELLNSPRGLVLRNSVGVALCYARDEALEVEIKTFRASSTDRHLAVIAGEARSVIS